MRNLPIFDLSIILLYLVVMALVGIYFSRKNKSSNQFTKASGSILRKILQQLEAAGFVAKVKEGVHKGRIITPAGISLLAKAAARIKAR